ncbi:Cullin-domain-containing protein [Aureobasidium pullulans]|uniref:Cullin-domain-containing protein n=1 Tax=Aureobasidium pullulans TaxID=5580 RepID=A0A4S8YW82_AURPU|nr:Cullin-domain-containing protein [Aureobasidium pullulans]
MASVNYFTPKHSTMSHRVRTKIRAPRRGVAGANDVDFDDTWTTLSHAFGEIHTKNASALSFEQLYRAAYKIVLKKKGDELYKKVSDFEKHWLSTAVRQDISRTLEGTILANNLDNSADTTSTAPERREAGTRFLAALKTAWQDHQTSMSMLTDVLMYMDRVYCTDTRQPSIFSKAMSLFRDSILYPTAITVGDQSRTFLDVLNRIILDQIHMDRDGDYIDKSLIKANTYMLEGLFETDQEGEDEKLYLTKFEQNFLARSAEFYREESARLLKDSDAGTYCRHVKRRIDEEADRCRSTLSESTSSKIIKVVEDELIRQQIKALIEMDSGVQFMITNDRHDDLGLVFELESRVDPKKPELTRAVQKIIQEMGTNVNSNALNLSTGQPAPVEDGENNTEKEKAKPVEKVVNQQTVAALKWVEAVLELKDRFDRIWKLAFKQDQVLQTAQTRSFSDTINAFQRSSEYISLFIDDNMKKGIKGKTEEEIDEVLEKAITLVRYLQDKDVFETYYKKHLCRRLLMNKSVSIDVEKQMISRMKIELGNSFTVKMEAMFKDMTLSEELTSGYQTYVSKLGDNSSRRIDLSINVLTSMTWPMETMKGLDEERDGTVKTVYPPAIERIKTSFEQFYSTKYSGRVLSWQGSMGTADIKATFKVPGKDGGPPKIRTHELNVSTYAMIVLTLFNELPADESLTCEDIQAQTNIPRNELFRTLQSLAVAPKTRILTKEPMSKDVKLTDRFAFNEKFTSKFIKVKVGVVSAGNKVENDKERKDTEKKNNDSRGFVIEAAIVRIMKQRKDLSHSQLVTETLTQLSQQFKPDVTMIKKKIESLIEREYLERIEDAKVPSYRYLA